MTGWRDRVVVPAGAEPDAGAAEALIGELGADEQPLAAFRTWRFEVMFEAKMATVVLTTRRLLVAKDKMFGRPKLSRAVDLREIVGSSFGPLLGVGPTWEVALRLRSGGVGTMYFDGPSQCEPIESRLRSAVLALNSGRSSADTSSHPAPPESPEPQPPELAARVRRNYAFLRSLQPLATAEMVGQPFGEGFGLEEAMALVPQHFPDVREMRESHQMLCVDLLVATGKTFEPDDLDDIMGTNESAFQSYEIAPAQFGAVTSLSGAARAFLGQFGDDGAFVWELWRNRDDVAAEFLCWHAVALLRLVAIGKMPALDES